MTNTNTIWQELLTEYSLIEQPLSKDVNYNVDTYTSDPEIPSLDSADERHTSDSTPVLYEV